MAEELQSIEDVLSKLRIYLESKSKRHPPAKPDVNSSARSHLDNVHDILYRIEGKRTVSTKTLEDILWDAEQRNWETLWKKYHNGTFQTATQELKTLMETFHKKYQPQASGPEVQTPRTENKVPAVHQTPRGPEVPVEPASNSQWQRTSNLESISTHTEPFETSHAAGYTGDDGDHNSYQTISHSAETTRPKYRDQDSDQTESVGQEENSHRDSSDYHRKKRGTMKKQASQEELEEKDREIKDLQNRVSKLAGDNLKKGNPNIADLSNKNRPTKLAERFSELYDNEWCDAYEELTEVTGGSSDGVELDVIRKLHKVVQESRRFCSITIKSQLSKLSETLRHHMVQQDVNDDMQQSPNMSQTDEMTKMMEEAESHLKQAQRVTAPLSIPVLKQRFRKHMENEFTKPSINELKHLGIYIDKCVEIIWLMSLQDPPMYLGECRPNDKSPTDFREYTERGSIVVALVWPSLHLYSRGPVLTKGVAIMK